MIEAYEFGRMKVGGQVHTRDLMIIDGQVKANWWRDQGHLLQARDLEEVLEAEPEVLVVGTGAHGVMRIDPDLERLLAGRRIELVAAHTADAVGRFNRCHEAGRAVAGAFHLTC